MEHHPDVKKHCAKAYLDYVRSLSQRIQSLQENIERQKTLMLPSGINYTESVSQSTSGDNLENGVIKLHELIAEYCTELSEYVEQQHIAHDVFNALSKPEYNSALTHYYLLGKSWEQVCVEMGYTWQGMMSLRKKAIQEVYDYMPEEWRRYSIPKAEVV